MKISIIIPFYDKDHNFIPTMTGYLNKLSYNKEVIFIDDRNDKSENIRAKYNVPEEYKIVPSSKTSNNVGTFEARRTGFNYSIGDYIWFIDIDDIPYNIDLEIDENNPMDVYIFKYDEYALNRRSFITDVETIFKYEKQCIKDIFDNRHNKFDVVINLKDRTFKEKLMFFNYFIDRHYSTICYTLWEKLLKRSVVEKGMNAIATENHLTFGDDTLLIQSVLGYSETINISSKKIYRYNISEAYKYSPDNVSKYVSKDKLERIKMLKTKYLKDKSWSYTNI